MGIWFSWSMLVAGLLVILLGCDIFTNSIEWLGKKLDLNEGILGSVFAAVGTAMPETLIPVVALVFGSTTADSSANDVGLGAIIGAPFMLSTIAMLVTGTAIIIFALRGRRTFHMRINARVLSRDIRFFLIAFSLALLASFVAAHEIKVALAGGLLCFYGFYVYRHATDSGHVTQEEVEDLSPLHFSRKNADPGLPVVVLQAVVGLALIVGAAWLFVQYVSDVALSVGVTPLVLSLIVVPLATELPEKFNSVLWVRRSRDTLAMGNITGAMVFQSTLPVSIGLVFTEWRVSPEYFPAFLQALLAIVAASILFSSIVRHKALTVRALVLSGAWYVAWLALVFPLSSQVEEFVRKMGWGV